MRKLRRRLFHATASILVLSVILIFAACQSQDSGVSQVFIEESPSPIVATATETPTITAAVFETAAQATPTMTPATPSPRPQPAATPPAAIPTASPTATGVPTLGIEKGPRVNVGDAALTAEIANTPALRTKGLSERDSLDSQTGMLFIFDNGIASAFWMKGMRFPLDFVWIGHDCTVVDVTKGVPNEPPDTPNSSLPIYRSSVQAEYNLELNAGEVERLGIRVGDSVTFEMIDVQGANC